VNVRHELERREEAAKSARGQAELGERRAQQAAEHAEAAAVRRNQERLSGAVELVAGAQTGVAAVANKLKAASRRYELAQSVLQLSGSDTFVFQIEGGRVTDKAVEAALALMENRVPLAAVALQRLHDAQTAWRKSREYAGRIKVKRQDSTDRHGLQSMLTRGAELDRAADRAIADAEGAISVGLAACRNEMHHAAYRLVREDSAALEQAQQDYEIACAALRQAEQSAELARQQAVPERLTANETRRRAEELAVREHAVALSAIEADLIAFKAAAERDIQEAEERATVAERIVRRSVEITEPKLQYLAATAAKVGTRDRIIPTIRFAIPSEA
jgi:hypothetical protein